MFSYNILVRVVEGMVICGRPMWAQTMRQLFYKFVILYYQLKKILIFFSPIIMMDLIIYMYCEGPHTKRQFLQSMETLYYISHFAGSKNVIKRALIFCEPPSFFFQKIISKCNKGTFFTCIICHCLNSKYKF